MIEEGEIVEEEVKEEVESEGEVVEERGTEKGEDDEELK